MAERHTPHCMPLPFTEASLFLLPLPIGILPPTTRQAPETQLWSREDSTGAMARIPSKQAAKVCGEVCRCSQALLGNCDMPDAPFEGQKPGSQRSKLPLISTHSSLWLWYSLGLPSQPVWDLVLTDPAGRPRAPRIACSCSPLAAHRTVGSGPFRCLPGHPGAPDWGF
jgi:hypothetical protein